MAQEQPIIFFDLDGTLLDVSERHFRVYRDGVLEAGGSPLDKPSYWTEKRQKTSWPNLLILSKVDYKQHAVFMENFIARIETSEYLKFDVLYPGVVRMLHDLSNKKYLISLRRSREQLTEEVARLGISDLFIRILNGHAAQDGEGFQVKVDLIKSLGVSSGILVGDTEADILAAKALGFRSVAVLSGIRNESVLRQLQPSAMLASVTDLPQLLANNVTN